MAKAGWESPPSRQERQNTNQLKRVSSLLLSFLAFLASWRLVLRTHILLAVVAQGFHCLRKLLHVGASAFQGAAAVKVGRPNGSLSERFGSVFVKRLCHERNQK